jgi:hypothetical protein
MFKLVVWMGGLGRDWIDSSKFLINLCPIPFLISFPIDLYMPLPSINQEKKQKDRERERE